MKLDYTKTGSIANGGASPSQGDSSASNVPKNFDPSLIDSPSQSFGNQPNRNPFGQSTSSFSTLSSSQTGNQKSLYEMVQEQKLQQQQQLQTQPTGMNFQTPQMTGFQQPSMTGYNGQSGSAFF
jgi:epsin